MMSRLTNNRDLLFIFVHYLKIIYVDYFLLVFSIKFQVLLSERPEYNEKIKAGFLMAPAVFMNTAYNPILQLAEWAEILEELYHSLGYYEFLPHPDLVTWLGHEVCNGEEHPIYADVCSNLAFLLFGINPDQLNQ